MSFTIEVEDGAWLDLHAIQAYLFTHDRVPRNFALLSSVDGFKKPLDDFGGILTAPKSYGHENRIADLREVIGFRELTGNVEFRIYIYGAAGSEYLVAGLGNTEGYELTIYGDLHGAEADFLPDDSTAE